MFTLNTDPISTTRSLSSYANVTNIFEWFVNADDVCGWSNFTIKKEDKVSGLLSSFAEGGAVTIDATNGDILVKTNASLDVTIVLNVSTYSGSWATKKIKVFICDG